MGVEIFCPNYAEACPEKKELHPGIREEKIGIEFAHECPKCKVLFHEDQLG